MRSITSKQKRRGGKKKNNRLEMDRRFDRYRKENDHGPKFPVQKTVHDTVSMFKARFKALVGAHRLQLIEGMTYDRKDRNVGEGLSGRVFNCVLPNLPNGSGVVKEMSIKKIKVGDKDSVEFSDVLKVHTFLDRCYSEMKIQLYFEKDARVVKLLGGVIQNSPNKVYCGLIMEKEETSLHAFLVFSRHLPVSVGARICLELMSLAQLTQGFGFVHNDLHPSNVLCTRGGTRLKICDFGQAAAFGNVFDDVVPHGKNITVASIYGKAAHLGPKHWSDKADASCDHYSLAGSIMSVLHGYYHSIVKLLRDNPGKVFSPFPDAGVCCPSSQRLRSCSDNDRRVATLVQPVTLLLKQCLERGEVLKVDEVKTALNELVLSDAASEMHVWFVLRDPPLPFASR